MIENRKLGKYLLGKWKEKESRYGNMNIKYGII